jgi:hypothetical protein
MSERGAQWTDFRTIVAGHIDNYTIPQYGDFPDDEVAQHWDAAQCVDAIGKYVTRYRVMRRGRLETLRDMAKVAHFACMAFYMMSPSQDEIDKILEGKV